MRYTEMIEATFVSRPNRFISHCKIGDTEVVAHVKNTGRCKELLIPGVTVYLSYHDDSKRKTAYSLIHVKKGDRLINMDSQAPNQLAWEAIASGKLVLPFWEEPITAIKREKTYGASRFDLYVEAGEKKAFIEVKGVTLEEAGEVRFPDAPSERAVKHVDELIEAKQNGYEAAVLFVIQMKDVTSFGPNWQTHQAFGEALERAQKAGVAILAYDCQVAIDEVVLAESVPVRLR